MCPMWFILNHLPSVCWYGSLCGLYLTTYPVFVGAVVYVVYISSLTQFLVEGLPHRLIPLTLEELNTYWYDVIR